MERFPLPLADWDGLRYFIVALPEPSINYFVITWFRLERFPPPLGAWDVLCYLLWHAQSLPYNYSVKLRRGGSNVYPPKIYILSNEKEQNVKNHLKVVKFYRCKNHITLDIASRRVNLMSVLKIILPTS